MVLSVLIVCFFAVALFQRGICIVFRVAEGGDRRRARIPVARTSPACPACRRHAICPGQRRDAPSRAAWSGRQRDVCQVLRTNPTYNGVDRTPSAVSAPVGFRRIDLGQPANAHAPPSAHGSDRPGEQIRQTSARATGRAPQAIAAGPPQKTAPARSGRSAFTTAREFETIEDVSSRVYGSREHGDLLWRANRDTLPQRNSPLSTGMLLRTPSIR